MKAHLCGECGRPLPTLDGFELNKLENTIAFRDLSIRLEPILFTLFAFLLAHGARPASEGAIYDHLYDLKPDCDQPNQTVMKVHIHKLRKALKPLGVVIRNVWGVGYSIELEHEAAKAAKGEAV